MQSQCIIIGGGLAGLYAAYRLQQLNIDFQLFEASHSLGGRIQSSPNLTAKGQVSGEVDMGPTWIWPHQGKILSLLRDLNLQWFSQFESGEALFQAQENQQVQRFAGMDVPPSYRLRGSLSALTQSLANSLDQNCLKLGQQLNTLDYDSDNKQWILGFHQQDEQVSASQVILAIPPRKITALANMKDLLPEVVYQQFLQTQTWMAAQAKFVAIYPAAFWRQEGLAGQAFSRVGPLGEIHDACAEADRLYALFGFLSMPPILRRQHSQEQIEQLCLRQLGQLFGHQALQPVHYYYKDWALEEHICSEADRLEPSQHTTISPSQYQAWSQQYQLYFAGSEFGQQNPGYLEGALEAVDSIINKLKV